LKSGSIFYPWNTTTRGLMVEVYKGEGELNVEKPAPLFR
jgi:hypothetical protein